MRTPSARLSSAVLLLAALACSGEPETMAPTDPDQGPIAAAKTATRVIEVSPATDPVSFGAVQGPFESATPTTQTFTVTNVGTRVTSGLTLSISGAGAAAYSIKAGDDGCTGKSLALTGKNKSCTVKVTFAPAAAGTFAAALNVAIAQPKATVTVNLSGTGAHSTSLVIISEVIGQSASVNFSTTGGLSPATFALADGGSRAFQPAPGPYTVTAVVPAGYDLIGVVCQGSQTSGLSFSANVPLATLSATIPEGASLTCTFTSAEIIALRGTVFNDNNLSGGLSTGEPGHSGATVRLKDGADILDEATSGADGTYAFLRVAAGSYTIETVPPAGTAITTGNAQPRSVTVAGASISGLDVGLSSTNVHGLVNLVVDGVCHPSNPGAAGVPVNISTFALPDGAPTLLMSTVTGSDGIFRVLLPLNAAGQGYLVATPNFATSFQLTIAAPARPLSWFEC